MKKRIVLIGGGTGPSNLLQGLRRYPVLLTMIVSTADSGGSSGVLRNELDIPPVGDIKQCVLALGEFSPEERDLWNYRFTKGKLKGHSIGNLILAGLAEATGSLETALEHAKKIWHIKGDILPMTTKATTLCVRYNDGTVVCGEHEIDEPKMLHGDIVRAYLKKQEAIAEKAVKAIKQADLIVLGPGDLYTGTVPALLTHGIHKALQSSRAQILYISNLMTSRGETDGFTLSRLIEMLNHYLYPHKVDSLLVNSSKIPSAILKRYRKYGETEMIADLTHPVFRNINVMRKPLLDTAQAVVQVKADPLRRSLIRHDSDNVARSVIEILRGYS
ncbi:MAG: YvcK family protein [bacterium]|nr:YvcK family protein [bacterium]